MIARSGIKGDLVSTSTGLEDAGKLLNNDGFRYIIQFTFWSLSDVSYSDECQTKKASSILTECSHFFCAIVKMVLCNLSMKQE